MSGTPNYIYFNLSRPVYGMCLSYLLAIIVTAKEDASFFRPSGFLRAFLSWSFWLPIATVSYSFYVWHVPLVFDKGLFNLQPELKKDQVCPAGGTKEMFSYYIKNFWASLAVCGLVAVLSYICIEKPAIDARVTYKNKFQR